MVEQSRKTEFEILYPRISITEDSGLNPEMTLYNRAIEIGLPIQLVHGSNFRQDLDSERQVEVYTDKLTARLLYDLRDQGDIQILRDAFEGYVPISDGYTSPKANKIANKLFYLPRDEKMNAGQYHPLHNAVRHVTDTVLFSRMSGLYLHSLQNSQNS